MSGARRQMSRILETSKAKIRATLDRFRAESRASRDILSHPASETHEGVCIVDGQDVLRRRLLILASLSHSELGITVRELAAEHQVDLKTIRRDLVLLRAIGCALEEITGKRNLKSWKLSTPPPGLPALKFNYLEVVALFLSHRLLDPLADTCLWKESRTAISKIRAHLDQSALKLIDRIAAGFHFTTGGHGSYSDQFELIEQLQLAVEDRRIAQVIYHPVRTGKPETYETYPLGFVYHRGLLYLVAHVPTRRGIRHFKINRMQHAEAWAFKFDPPAGFILSDHLKGAFGVYVEAGDQQHQVRVRFTTTPITRHVSESKWHPSQTLVPNSDGSLIAEFTLSSLKEVKSWILSFGPNAQALEPPELVQQIQSDIARMVTVYGSPATTRTMKRARKSG